MSSSSPLPTAAVNRKGQPKKFHRILWDSDAATRDGMTSIGVLLAWLAAPGNYERWRDGKSQFGETREALCSQIKAEMARHGILHRENANIRTHLSELERSFDNATAWLTQNGFGGRLPAANASGAQEVEAHVLRLCRYFHTLEPVMGVAARSPASAMSVASQRGRQRRPTGRAGKQASEDGDEHRSATEAESPTESSSVSTGETAATTMSEEEATADSPMLREELTAETPAMTALAERAAERRQPAVLSQKRTAPSSPSSASSSAFTDGTTSSDSSSAPAHVPVVSSPESPSGITLPTVAAASPPPPAAPAEGVQELTPPAQAALSPPIAAVGGWQAAGSDPASCESAQRAAFDAAREERDRKRFRMDEERNRLECEKLRYEIQVAKLKLQVERALARKKLEKADLSPAEVIAAVEL